MLKFAARAVALTAVLSLSAFAMSPGEYPMGPDTSGLTPGETCQHPDSYRYKEHVPYCSRSVTTDQKWAVINAYNQKFGYNINKGNRQEFKIDHFIPLCMGGGNDLSNLWPQHNDIYPLTDPLEQLACQRMAEGHLLQADAIALIQRAKLDLSQVDAVMSILQGL